MSELEKVIEEFETMCKTHNGCTVCEWYGKTSCALAYMFSREQKLKSEAVKIVAELKEQLWEFGDKFDEAIKKIEGL